MGIKNILEYFFILDILNYIILASLIVLIVFYILVALIFCLFWLSGLLLLLRPPCFVWLVCLF